MMTATAQTKTRTGLVAALDVGTTKICCLIARVIGDRPPRIIGWGHQESKGLRNGAIVRMDDAEASIRATVEAAERMAGENIRQVAVNLAGGQPESRLVAYEVSIDGREIVDADLHRILDTTDIARDLPSDREMVHAIPVSYSIDGSRGVRDPRGMHGDKLGVNMHVISAQSGPLRNLKTCVERCHLDMEATVAAPYASALSSVVEDERQLGVTLIEMGGGATSVAVFFDGELVHTDALPVGGTHVTNDIARGLSTGLAHAERMKTLYGNAMPSPSDDREILKVPPIADEGGAEPHQVPRSMLVGIIRPRVEEIFEITRSRLEAAGFDKVAGRRVVLTGGASQLPGLAELAGMILDKQVRVARPRSMDGLAESVSGPPFAACVGLLRYALDRPLEAPKKALGPIEQPKGRFGRLGQWLRENF